MCNKTVMGAGKFEEEEVPMAWVEAYESRCRYTSGREAADENEPERR